VAIASAAQPGAAGRHHRPSSMTFRSALVIAWAAALAWALVACGGSPPQSPAAAPVVDVTIAKGQVTPTNATMAAKVHQQITIRVNSDAADELHVHSTPDHKFPVAAAPNQTFQFSVDVPGNVEVELHHLDRTIATIQVQP
jgi:multidrug efflux pump subunit AcrA (membrane-fusion protein)